MPHSVQRTLPPVDSVTLVGFWTTALYASLVCVRFKYICTVNQNALQYNTFRCLLCLSTYIAVCKILYSCQFSPYLIEKYHLPPQILKEILLNHYIFHHTFRMFMAEWRIEGFLKNLVFNLIQDRNIDFLRNIHFTFLKNLTVSVVRCFRERFCTFYNVSLRPGTKSHKPVNKEVRIC